MADVVAEPRRYCSVCGYLSSEPVALCPRCTMSTSSIPAVAVPPVVYGGVGPYEGGRRGPPAWAVLTAVLLLAVGTVLLTLLVDGVLLG